MVRGLLPRDNERVWVEALVPGEAPLSHGFASSWGVKTVDEVSLITLSWPDVMRETISFLLDVALQEKENSAKFILEVHINLSHEGLEIWYSLQLTLQALQVFVASLVI